MREREISHKGKLEKGKRENGKRTRKQSMNCLVDRTLGL